LRFAGSVMDFGGMFAYKSSVAPRANQTKEKNMAKKTLKKSKKIEATKPLMTLPGKTPVR